MGMTTEALDVVIDNTSDKRVDNAVRHEYLILTDAEEADIKEIRDLGTALIAKIQLLDGYTNQNREYSIALTRAEEAVMWAINGVSKVSLSNQRKIGRVV